MNSYPVNSFLVTRGGGAEEEDENLTHCSADVVI